MSKLPEEAEARAAEVAGVRETLAAPAMSEALVQGLQRQHADLSAELVALARRPPAPCRAE